MSEEKLACGDEITGIYTAKVEEVFCDKCGNSCMHEGHNYIGISMDISGLPISLRNAVGFDKFTVCYPCWIDNLGINK